MQRSATKRRQAVAKNAPRGTNFIVALEQRDNEEVDPSKPVRWVRAAAIRAVPAILVFAIVCTCRPIDVDFLRKRKPPIALSNDQNKCFRDEIRYFQVYHISKCGGINMLKVLSIVFHIRYAVIGSWWREEKENKPDIQYQRDPNNILKKETFILGLIRSPFGYYRSLYGMLMGSSYQECKKYIRSNGTMGDFKQCPCGMRRAHVHGMGWLFNETNRNNVSAFAQWLELVLTDEPAMFYFIPKTAVSGCNEAMQDRHDNLMTMNDGSMAYDAVVRQERYYPSLRKALEKFRPCAPTNATLNLAALDELEERDRNEKSRAGSRFGFAEVAAKERFSVIPDYCFYSSELRRMVEERDATYMERYGYTWENFVGNGSVAEDCKGVQSSR